MTRDNTQSDRRLTRRQRTAVSLLAVVCIILAGATLAVAQQTFTDDFEDGDVDGWQNQESGVSPVVSTMSVEANYSLFARTEQLSNEGPLQNTAYEWNQGPLLDTEEPFNVSTVVRPEWRSYGGGGIRLGVVSEDQSEDGQNALLIFDGDDGQTFLATATQQSPSTGNEISSAFEDTWVNVKINSPGDGQTLRAKVWEYGTSEPSQWQLERSDFDSVEPGRFSVNTGNSIDSGERRLFVDSVSVTGEEAESQNLRMDIPGYLPHNESSSYTVEYNQSGTWTDVTDQATISTSNDDAVTFYPDNGTVVAGGNKSINERVDVTASYSGLATNNHMVVATPTVDNLDLLPAWWSVNAVLSDWTMVWILMATLIATAATRMATTFAGIGAFVMAMIMGWIMGDVPDGIMVATILMGIFIGLNLAANIDYSVR